MKMLKMKKEEGKEEDLLALLALDNERVLGQIDVLVLELEVFLACQMLLKELQVRGHLVNCQIALDLKRRGRERDELKDTWLFEAFLFLLFLSFLLLSFLLLSSTGIYLVPNVLELWVNLEELLHGGPLSHFRLFFGGE